MKFNFMGVKNGVFSWKQVEVEGGKVFVRFKKRPFVVVRKK